jgi:carbon monoxide dehydrogenase subunit G
MPSVEHIKLIAAPQADVWNFVADMANWAPFLYGYQRHQVIDDSHSIWSIKGEVGGLIRSVDFRVTITEWSEVDQRVRFTLEGVNEPLSGAGTFLISRCESAESVEPVLKLSWFSRFKDSIVRRFFDMVLKRGQSGRSKHSGPDSAADIQSKVLFKLDLNAGGAAGGVLNLMVAPMLKPVAEDLADAIGEQVEIRQETNGA